MQAFSQPTTDPSAFDETPSGLETHAVQLCHLLPFLEFTPHPPPVAPMMSREDEGTCFTVSNLCHLLG